MNPDKEDRAIKLELMTPKQVMEAFLAGHRLGNSAYDTEEMWLYLDDVSGYICEEDGAGAKANRLPIGMRNNEKWWIMPSPKDKTNEGR